MNKNGEGTRRGQMSLNFIYGIIQTQIMHKF